MHAVQIILSGQLSALGFVIDLDRIKLRRACRIIPHVRQSSPAFRTEAEWLKAYC
jgi:hypothetical protein